MKDATSNNKEESWEHKCLESVRKQSKDLSWKLGLLDNTNLDRLKKAVDVETAKRNKVIENAK